MSEPKRYDPQLDNTGEFDIVMVKSSDGGFVKWDDYTRLKAEVENSKRINTELLVLSNRQASDIRRLTKAGDELERVLISRSGSYEAGNASHEWQSAKNYKPTL